LWCFKIYREVIILFEHKVLNMISLPHFKQLYFPSSTDYYILNCNRWAAVYTQYKHDSGVDLNWKHKLFLEYWNSGMFLPVVRARFWSGLEQEYKYKYAFQLTELIFHLRLKEWRKMMWFLQIMDGEMTHLVIFTESTERLNAGLWQLYSMLQGLALACIAQKFQMHIRYVQVHCERRTAKHIFPRSFPKYVQWSLCLYTSTRCKSSKLVFLFFGDG